MQAALIILLGYFLGAIPFAYIIPKLISGIDIRTIGSKNVGATNVARAVGGKWAAVVFILDAMKGALFVVVLKLLTPQWFETQWVEAHDVRQLSLLLPIIGHCYTIFLGFKGGKGVATTGGIILLISPLAFLAGAIAYIVGLKALKQSFVGSFSALLTFVLLDLFVFHSLWWLTLGLITALLIFQHRSNIMGFKNATRQPS